MRTSCKICNLHHRSFTSSPLEGFSTLIVFRVALSPALMPHRNNIFPNSYCASSSCSSAPKYLQYSLSDVRFS
ncbi:hypothetical protein DY000_02040218 [Brassica cretica]|uniref:Uncharacterized protein n=1 Tax=Brassica cretica TaxID=69181 RepID=A0ABQ7BCN3_BRACR|nr:hypothetical protein DY000_02040218 [Brassica cretica]